MPLWVLCIGIFLITLAVRGENSEPLAPLHAFLAQHCTRCHDGAEAKGGLDLVSLAFPPVGREGIDQWTHVFDRVTAGEMPPSTRRQPRADEVASFLGALSLDLNAADEKYVLQHGRSMVRRLNRREYENTLREALDAPWLHMADMLPEDGTRYFFNKTGSALDISHVQIQGFLKAAEYALRMSRDVAAHPARTDRYYAREEPTFHNYLWYRPGQVAATRSIMPLRGLVAEPEVIRKTQPLSVGKKDPVGREEEALGVFSGTYEATTKYDFTRMEIVVPGEYRLRIKSYAFRAGPGGRSGGSDHGLSGGQSAWWRPDRNVALPAVRSEPITLYSLTSGGESRWLATYDAQPDPHVIERSLMLREGEMIRPDATRLVRTRPDWRGNPNATPEGVPGVAFNWLEVEGPIHPSWPPPSYKAIFADLPFAVDEKNKSVEPRSAAPEQDARRLLERFALRTLQSRRSEIPSIEPYLDVFKQAQTNGFSFGDAMVSAYAAFLCSPHVLFIQPAPGPLPPEAIAERLAFFLWDGPPDTTLLNAARAGDISSHLGAMLASPRSEHFVHSFLDYWLNLRDIAADAPDAELYPDYYLDEWLTESSLMETRLFFRDMLHRDLPARHLIQSDFSFVNERLAAHYGLPGPTGVRFERVAIPPGSPRGGLLTHASVLKVTANGTTTSPILRGVWIAERLLGIHIYPPPSGVGSIEPDIRGAVTVRDQLALHTSSQSCASCHEKFDPYGFALENFDVAGGWRDQYRAIGAKGEPVKGLGKNGHLFRFVHALPVEASGMLPGGSEFGDVRDVKHLLLRDERRIARALLRHLIVYSTGAAVSFADRGEVEAILDRTRSSGYGVQSLVRELVASPLFLNK